MLLSKACPTKLQPAGGLLQCVLLRGCSAHCQSQSPIKTLDSISVSRFGEEIEVEVAARSFLHHQVRSIVGCLKLVGTGKWTKVDLKHALAARDRNALGFNAPPDGLYFVEAIYPD